MTGDDRPSFRFIESAFYSDVIRLDDSDESGDLSLIMG